MLKTNFWKLWADFVEKKSGAILLFFILTTCFFAVFVYRIEINTDLKDYHRKESSALSSEIEDKFHEGNYLNVTFETQTGESAFSPQMLQRQFLLLEEIKKRFKVKTYGLADGINEALKSAKGKTLLDENDYSTIAQGIIALSGGRTVTDLEKVSRNLLSDPEVIHFYQKLRVALSAFVPFLGGGKMEFSTPFVKAVKAYVELDPSYSEKEMREVSIAIRDLANTYTSKDLAVYIYGEHIFSDDIDSHTRGNVIIMILILFVVESLIFLKFFRSVKDVIVVFTILSVASVCTLGMGQLLGIKFSFLHLLVLPLLIGTSDDNSFVFGMRAKEEIAKGTDLSRAVGMSYESTGTGIFLATFTTLTAFLAGGLINSSPAIRSFNLLVALSMAVTFFTDVGLEGPLRLRLAKSAFLDRMDNRLKQRIKPSGTMSGLAPLGLRALTGNPRAVVLCGALLLCIGTGLAFKIGTIADISIFLRRTMPSYHAYHISNKYFGRSENLGYVIFDGNVESAALLEKMRALKDRLKNYGIVEKILGQPYVESINDLIDKKGEKVTNETDVRSLFGRLSHDPATFNYVIDESFEEASKHFVHRSDDHYDALSMRFYFNGENPKEVLSFDRALKKEIGEIGFDEIPGVRVRVGGGHFVNFVEEKYYFNNSVQSFFVSLLPNFLLLLFVWKKMRYAALATVPLLFSAVMTLGMMALFGVRLNILNLTIGDVIVGLGIDYPIYIVERYRNERQGGVANRLKAMSNVLTSIGPGIFGGAVTTIVGFISFCVLAMPVAESFGIFSALAMFFVYAASILMLPIFLARRYSANKGQA